MGGDSLHLLFVCLHDVGVDMVSLSQVGVGDGDNYIDFAALQFGPDSIAEVEFGRAQLIGQFDIKVQLFAVQRLDFYGDFLLVKSLFGYAIACHGTNHDENVYALLLHKMPRPLAIEICCSAV